MVRIKATPIKYSERMAKEIKIKRSHEAILLYIQDLCDESYRVAALRALASRKRMNNANVVITRRDVLIARRMLL